MGIEDLAQDYKVLPRTPKFVISDELANFPGMAPRKLYDESNFAGIYKHYGLEPRDFAEKVANLANPEALGTNEPLLINWVTSADVIAERAGKLEDRAIYSLSACPVTVTRDNQVVLGVRGGAITPERIKLFGSGQFCTVPGGSIAFETSYAHDPVTDTTLKEAREELGNFEFAHPQILGSYWANKPGPDGLKFTSVLKVSATLEELQNTNRAANTTLKQLMSGGLKRKPAQEQLAQRGFPKDSWEQDLLFGIPSDPDSVRHFVETQRDRFFGASGGALMTYVKSFE